MNTYLFMPTEKIFDIITKGTFRLTGSPVLCATNILPQFLCLCTGFLPKVAVILAIHGVVKHASAIKGDRK